MEDLTILKCKNCGTVLDIRNAKNGVIECSSCLSVWTVPRQETEPEALKYLHDGNAALDVCKFEDAYVYFQKAAELDKKEPEAYFGMALAKFGVQYLKDYVNDRLQPICHEVTEKKFTDSKDYRNALTKATSAQKSEYEKRGKEIDYILEEFRKLKQSGVDYDCFICVKVTGENGQETEDSKDAESIYRMLQDKGYKPFYSERELRNVTGADYEARILYALASSECMLVVCRNEEYLQTPWVKNEYTRFLGLVNKEEKESDSIALVFSGAPIERLPGKNGKLQGIDFAKPFEAVNKILNFVETHTPEARARREEEAKNKAGQSEDIKALREEFQKSTEELRKSTKMQKGVQSTAASLLTRGYQELGDGHTEQAGGYFKRVLDADPNYAEAWWGKFLCEMGFWNDKQVNGNISDEQFQKIKDSVNYRRAVQFASGDFKQQLDKIQAELNTSAQTRKEQFENKQKQLTESKSEIIAKTEASLKETNKQITIYEGKKKKYGDDANGYSASLFKRIISMFKAALLLAVLITVGVHIASCSTALNGPNAKNYVNPLMDFLPISSKYGGISGLVLFIIFTIYACVTYPKYKETYKKIEEELPSLQKKAFELGIKCRDLPETIESEIADAKKKIKLYGDFIEKTSYDKKGN